MKALEIHCFTNVFKRVMTPRTGKESDSVEMAPLYEPDRIQFSFDTLGWKVFGCVLLCMLLLVVIVQATKYYKNTYRREAIKKLVDIDKQCT